MHEQNFCGGEFVNKAKGFDGPTQLPRDNDERRNWQNANRAWWQATPMRYDWREEIAADAGSKAYFEEIDRRFFSSAANYLPPRQRPFDALIDFEGLESKDVLEIGVGHGSHAALIAARAKSFTGIDLTEAAAAMTRKRFEQFGIPGTIIQMDAEEMSFADGSFDLIWSWGVIHHSADTRRLLLEMHRVLRRGGTTTVMVYHHNWWNFGLIYGLVKGIAQGQLRKHRSLHRVVQAATDGAIGRYYSVHEWCELAGDLFHVESIRILGQKSDVIFLPAGRVKDGLQRALPDSAARLLTNNLRMGSFLVALMRKI